MRLWSRQDSVSCAVAHEGPGERQQVPARRAAIGVGPRMIQPFEPGAGRRGPDRARTSRRIGPRPRCPPRWNLPATMKPKCSAIVQVALGRRLKQPPVPLVDGDDRLAERVDLIDPPELIEALDRSPQVAADAIGLGLRIESEAPVTLVGVLVIPRREQLVKLSSVARLLARWPRTTHAVNREQLTRPMTINRTRSMVASLGSSQPRGDSRDDVESPPSL